MGHRILFAAYRDWACEVLPYVKKHPRVSSVTHIISHEEMVIHAVNHKHEYDFILMCGWSGQPAQVVIDELPVFSEHPATSDMYSLGTPLQNQIMSGVKYTKHRLVKTVFPELALRQYSHEVDIDISGPMDDILLQMKSTSIMLYNMFLDHYPNVTWKTWLAVPQEDMFVPRVPVDSRLVPDDFEGRTTKQLYDFCRMLEGPYPRAYLEDEHGVLTFEKVSFKAK